VANFGHIYAIYNIQFLEVKGMQQAISYFKTNECNNNMVYV